jgi:hypothetical protein
VASSRGVGEDVQSTDQQAAFFHSCLEKKAEFVVEMKIGDSLNDGAIFERC